MVMRTSLFGPDSQGRFIMKERNEQERSAKSNKLFC